MNKYSIIILFAITLFLGNCAKEGSDATFATNASTTGIGGSTARFTIIGNYLYTVDHKNLRVFDISNSANFSNALVNTVNVGFEIETIFPFKNRLFIGSTSVIHIFDISNPTTPVKLSTAISESVMRRCDPVVAKDSVAYATLRTNGPCGGTQSVLATFDIKDIANPIQKFANNVQEPYGLGYADSTLYVCNRLGLSVYSITNPLAPLYVRNIAPTEWFFDVIPNNNYLYAWIKKGVMIYDITNRRNPSLIKKII
jgi:hypothetical protein